MLLNLFTGLIFWRTNVRDDFDIVGSFDKQRVSSINAERTVNLFEYEDPNAKRPKVLLPHHALSKLRHLEIISFTICYNEKSI